MVRHASEHDARLTDLSSVSLLAGEGGNKKKNLFLHASFSPSGRSRPLFLISQGQWRSRRFQKELELTSSSSSSSHTWQGGGPRWAEGLQISPTLTSVSLSILIRHRLSSCSETLKLTDQLRHSKKKKKNQLKSRPDTTQNLESLKTQKNQSSENIQRCAACSIASAFILRLTVCSFQSTFFFFFGQFTRATA